MNCFVFLSSNLSQWPPCDKNNTKGGSEKNHLKSTLCQPELNPKEGRQCCHMRDSGGKHVWTGRQVTWKDLFYLQEGFSWEDQIDQHT